MGMINIGEGLSALGNSVAKTAGDAALEQQKSNLENDRLRLADQLAGARAWSAPGVAEQVAIGKIGLQQQLAQHEAFRKLMGGNQPAPSSAPSQDSGQTTTDTSTTTIPSSSVSSSDSPSSDTTQPQPAAQTPSLPQGFTAIPDDVRGKMMNAYALGGPAAGLKIYSDWATEQSKVFDQRDKSRLITGAGVPVGEANTGGDKITPLTDTDRVKFGLAKDDIGYMSGEGASAKPVLLHEKNPQNPSVDRDLLIPALKRLSEGNATDADKIILQQLKPGSNTLLSDDAIVDNAWYFIQNNRMPTGARDKASSAAVMNKIAELKPAGMSNEAWMLGLQNNSIALHAKNAAAAQGGKMQLATTINEDTVVNSINILNGLLKKGVAGPTDVTSVNDVAQWLKRQVNDPDAVNLKNAISTISNEYARVMTGQTGGAASSDGARLEAAQRLLLGYTKGTMQSAADQMVKEMQGRSAAYERAVSQLTGGAYSGVAPSQEYTPTTGTGKEAAIGTYGAAPSGIPQEHWNISTPQERAAFGR